MRDGNRCLWLVVLTLTALSLSAHAAEEATVPDASSWQAEVQLETGLDLLPPDEESMACLWGWYCEGDYYLGAFWGHGSSCAEAQNDLDAQVTAAANGGCNGEDACGILVVYDSGCYWDTASRSWIIDGHGRYGCFVWYCKDWTAPVLP